MINVMYAILVTKPMISLGWLHPETKQSQKVRKSNSIIKLNLITFWPSTESNQTPMRSKSYIKPKRSLNQQLNYELIALTKLKLVSSSPW